MIDPAEPSVAGSSGVAAIRIRGARQHNLKNFNLDLPRGALSVITGVSGSGKSSLAFDTLYAEGQRRYVESVSAYARQFLERLPRPDVDVIHGLTPAVAIQQQSGARGARSTVGTATEIHDHLRLLFARLGVVHCARCGEPIRVDRPATIAAEAAVWPEGESVTVLAPVQLGKLAFADLAEQLMKAGFTRLWLNGEIVPLEPLPSIGHAREIRVVVDRFRWSRDESSRLAESSEQAFRRGEGTLELVRGAGAPEPKSERWICASCGTPAIHPEPGLFSFSSALGVCPECRGFGDVLAFDLERIVPDPGLTLRQGALRPWAGSWRRIAWPRLEKFARAEGIALDQPWSRLPERQRRVLIEGGEGFRGVIAFLERLRQKSYKAGNRFVVKKYQVARRCGTCGGARLRPEALAVRLAGRNIAEVGRMSVAEAAVFVRRLEFSSGEREIAGPVLGELEARLSFLERVDLGYLTLDRMTRTLSGGEAQRIELANALGAHLADTLYVLDEPTIGLHPRDTGRLIGILEDLAARGNTVVIVEHEPLVIRAADYLVDLGPGAGEQGGQLLYAGPAAGIAAADTGTARYLRGERRVERSARREAPGGDHEAFLVIEGAREHNLKDVTARFPLGRLNAVTGVSGSGKSSLIEDVLHRAALRHFERRGDAPVGEHRVIRGLERLKRVVMVDQSPIGRTPRSCPATYLGAFGPLREIYARQPAALARGLKEGAFSFNTSGGRCERCQGAGWVTVEMYFLADLMVPCEVCEGARFRREVLEVRCRGLNIREALDLTVDQAFAHFAREPRFTRTLNLLRRVGLGYLRLGQAATQLSGGEAQRLKIARELSVRGEGPALYLLDEPTVGLHFADVQRLLDVLDELTSRGDTVIVIEHNLDVIAACDWIVDLGPEGGKRGGALVAEGPPETIAATAASWTGRYLREHRPRGGSAAEPLQGAEASSSGSARSRASATLSATPITASSTTTPRSSASGTDSK